MTYYHGILLFLLSLLLAGCASQATVSDWQTGMNHYMNAQAGGNPAFMRDREMIHGRRIFRVNGRIDPKGSTDQVGVLLAHHKVGNQWWNIFLLGEVKNHHVESIRLAAMTISNKQMHWIMAKPDPTATKHYLAYQHKRWDTEHPQQAANFRPSFDWPRQWDWFQTSIDGPYVMVVEVHSHAVWAMKING